MQIRRAGGDDAAAIAEVHVRTWQAAYEHVFGADRLATVDLESRRRSWRRWLSAGETSFVAVEATRVIGFSWIGRSSDDDAEGELFAIYVLPDFWGTEAGSGLMDAALDALRDGGHRDAILWVLEDNPRARRFYEREGWALDGGRRTGEHLGVETAEVRYRILL